MREILFRAKSAFGNDWVYGYLTSGNDCSGRQWFISSPAKDPDDHNHFVGIDKETVGQYTDHYDKNCKRIYENDLVLYCGKIWKVIWSCGFWLEDAEDLGDNLGDICASDLEVIGNIYDNPELLGGKMRDDDTMRPEMELLKENAKQRHDIRVAKTPQRIEYTKQQLENNKIRYLLKNSENGHFHCFDKNGNLVQFWCSTGKIYYDYKTAQKMGLKVRCQLRGIQNLIKVIKEAK